jgi:hypothetical protein
MQKWNPQRYGDAQRLELTGADGGPVLLAQLSLLAMAKLEAETAAADGDGPSVIEDAQDPFDPLAERQYQITAPAHRTARNRQ